MEELVKVCEYELDKSIVNKCIEEDRKISNEDVKIEIHEILEDNKIEYKNKIEEKWKAKIGTQRKVQEYCLFVEIYVKEQDYDKAKKLIEEYLK